MIIQSIPPRSTRIRDFVLPATRPNDTPEASIHKYIFILLHDTPPYSTRGGPAAHALVEHTLLRSPNELSPAGWIDRGIRRRDVPSIFIPANHITLRGVEYRSGVE
jgi:hypothetical protein